MIIASYSSLKDYNSCKRKVYYRINRAPRLETASMLVGSTIHNMVEDVENGDWLGEDEYIKQLVTRLSSGNVKFYPGQKVPSLINHVKLCFENYKAVAGRLQPLYGVEVPFEIEYHSSDVKVVGKFDQFRGDVDTIVELKSTVKKPTAAFLNTDMQSTIYLWAFQQIYGTMPNYFHVHLPSGTVYRLVRDDFDDLILNLTDYIKDRDEQNFPRQLDGYGCDRCDYYDICIGPEIPEDNGKVEFVARGHFDYSNISPTKRFAEV